MCKFYSLFGRFLHLKIAVVPPLFVNVGRAFGFIFIFIKKKNKGYRLNPLRRKAKLTYLRLSFCEGNDLK